MGIIQLAAHERIRFFEAMGKEPAYLLCSARFYNEMASHFANNYSRGPNSPQGITIFGIPVQWSIYAGDRFYGMTSLPKPFEMRYVFGTDNGC